MQSTWSVRVYGTLGFKVVQTNQLKSRRHADIWSHPSCYLVNHYASLWSPKGHGHEWLIPIHFVNVNRLSHSWDMVISKFDHENDQGHVCGQRSRSHCCVTPIGLAIPMIQLFKNWTLKKPKVKTNGYIWGQVFNRYIRFLFRGNWTIFSLDTGNSIFDLRNLRSRSRPWANPLAIFEA